jgi:hypothetical protein
MMIDDYDYDMDDEMIERKIRKKTTVATMTWFPLLSAIAPMDHEATFMGNTLKLYK